MLDKFDISKILYIYNEILHSEAGKRYWQPCDGLNGWTYQYQKRSSTFPVYSKFFFTKKPRNYENLDIESQNQYFAGNKKELLHILKKVINNKSLTDRQERAINILYENFLQYEKDFKELYNEDLIKDEILNF